MMKLDIASLLAGSNVAFVSVPMSNPASTASAFTHDNISGSLAPVRFLYPFDFTKNANRAALKHYWSRR